MAVKNCPNTTHLTLNLRSKFNFWSIYIVWVRKLKYPAVVWYEFLLGIAMSMPRFRATNALKSLLLRALGAKVGARVVYYPGVRIMPAHGITIGDDVDLAWDVIVTTSGQVEIGNRVLIGYRTIIISANHTIPPAPARIF